MSKLAENIRNYRKEMGFTQEELAERLGITLGTISKWERGSSEPDIDYIMDLAEIFRISVDVLIGFSMKGNTPEMEVDRIDKIIEARNFNEAVEEYEKALLKFPNVFKIVYRAAWAYYYKGVTYYKDDNKDFHRAVELLKHSLELIGQNNDPEINEVNIKNLIGSCYSHMKDYKKAIEEYKSNNVNGINNDVIGTLLIDDLNENEEGRKYLIKAFFKMLTETVTVSTGFINYYRNTMNADKCLDAVKWIRNYVYSLKIDPKATSFADKLISVFYLVESFVHDNKGDLKIAKEFIDKAIDVAANFDRNPCYNTENIIFANHLADEANVFDDLGETALKGLVRQVEERENFDLSKEYLDYFYKEIKKNEGKKS
jgi:transcriptional regulator with XRE-family HTH domain